MIRCQVLATKECGLLRHEAANACGEMAMCRPAERLVLELAIANLEVKGQVNEIC